MGRRVWSGWHVAQHSMRRSYCHLRVENVASMAWRWRIFPGQHAIAATVGRRGAHPAAQLVDGRPAPVPVDRRFTFIIKFHIRIIVSMELEGVLAVVVQVPARLAGRIEAARPIIIRELRRAGVGAAPAGPHGTDGFARDGVVGDGHGAVGPVVVVGPDHREEGEEAAHGAGLPVAAPRGAGARSRVMSCSDALSRA